MKTFEILTIIQVVILLLVGLIISYHYGKRDEMDKVTSGEIYYVLIEVTESGIREWIKSTDLEEYKDGEIIIIKEIKA